MSQSELLLLASEYQDRIWTLGSWSVSIAIALFTMSSLLGKKLNIYQLPFVLITYIFYTGVVIRNLSRINSSLQATVEDMRELQSAGTDLSAVSQQVLENYTGGASILTNLHEGSYQILLFFGAITYLALRYISSRKVNPGEEQLRSTR